MFANPAEAYDGDRWITRYIYDMSQGSSVSMTGSPLFRGWGWKGKDHEHHDGGKAHLPPNTPMSEQHG
jgi:hypothetical protein